MDQAGAKHMNQLNDERTAVILSGGGAYGAYEVGVMKALFAGDSPGTDYKTLNPEIFTGTSVGAFNASVMAMMSDWHSTTMVEYLEDAWLNEIADDSRRCGNGVFRFRANPLRYLDTECFIANPSAPLTRFGEDASFLAQSLFWRSVNFLMAPGNLPQRVMQFVDISALISVEPFRRMLARTVSLENIRRSDKVLRIVATNWETGAAETFENRHMVDEIGYNVIMASAAIPGIFPPVEVAGDSYVDGGVVMNTPLKCALEAGATVLHIVYLDPDVGNIPLHRLMNMLDTIDRVYTIMLASKTNEDIDTAAWVNEGLTVMERAARDGSASGLSGSDITAFIRVAAAIQKRIEEGQPYRKLTIHRYHPHDSLGGTMGMLNFNRQAIGDLIERGFADALAHDCAKSHCIFPYTRAPAPKASASAEQVRRED
jgi:NTE family protein